MKHLNEQRTDSPIPTPAITEEPADLASRLYARSFDLRSKFVDGRGKAFKRDFPGWFAAFEEVIGMLRDAADCIERQRRSAARLKETEAVVMAATSLVASIRRHGFQDHVLSPEGQHLAMCVDALTKGDPDG